MDNKKIERTDRIKEKHEKKKLKKEEKRRKKEERKLIPPKDDKLWMYFVISFVMTIVIEGFCRRSFFGGFVFLFRHPFAFLINYTIVFFTYSLASFVPKRFFSVSLVTILWLTLSIIDFVLMDFRVTPLSAIDFYIFINVISIINVYVTKTEMVIYGILIAFGISALVFTCIKTPNFKFRWKRGLIALASSSAAFVILFIGGLKINAVSTQFENIGTAYDEYGFPYCFSLSIFDHGIERPDEYSESKMKTIESKIKPSGNAPKETPNIVFVQLESFFDVNKLKDIEFSENPIPNFTNLQKNYENGLLFVPTIGAGTVNTEFEVLTGMDLFYFGPGEYPYKTVLNSTTSESAAFVLKELGYSSSAIHNHEGSFYSRNEVYSMLGFDRFISIEYMDNEEINENGWAKDTILTKHIMDSMNLTDSNDFVFAVSVQAHGKYPDDDEGYADKINVVSGIDDDDLVNQFNYYLNEIKGTDDFIGDLYDEIMNFNEKTVVVLYGDHLPSLSLEKEMFESGDLLTTDYVIFSNYDMKTENLEIYENDISSNLLYPHLFEELGIENGFINRLALKFKDSDEYGSMLQNVMYDMLYGERFLFKRNEDFYQKTDIIMGLKEIKITNAYLDGKTLYVEGENFTEYSSVCVNGISGFSTKFISPELLKVSLISTSLLDYITVEQISDTMVTLSSTDKYYFDD